MLSYSNPYVSAYLKEQILSKITRLTALAACCLMLPVAAAELVNHADGRAVSLEGGARRVQVVNVWATWCAACRHEMPVLSRWYRQQQSRAQAVPVEMVGVALDQPANVSRFLQTTPVSYPVWRYTGRDSTAWMRRMGNPVGALPFTWVQMTGCTHRRVLLGEVDAEKLNRAVSTVRMRCVG